jgi:hypothetical protein
MREERPIMDPFEVTKNDVTVTENQEALAATEGKEIHVESYVWSFAGDEETEAAPDDFTREVFEAKLDKVSRPLKGRLAHVPYSSDDLIRDKRMDVELEDRTS